MELTSNNQRFVAGTLDLAVAVDPFEQIVSTPDTLWIRHVSGAALVVRPVGGDGESTGDEEHYTPQKRTRAEHQLAEYDPAEIRQLLSRGPNRAPRKADPLALVSTLEFRKACRDLTAPVGRIKDMSVAARDDAVDAFVATETRRLIARETSRSESAVFFTRFGARLQSGNDAQVAADVARECSSVK